MSQDDIPASIEVDVLRGNRVDQMFIYVRRERGLADVPDGLRKHFGTPRLVMTLQITATRKLARANAEDVLRQVHREGYFVQLPPAKEWQLSGEHERRKDDFDASS